MINRTVAIDGKVAALGEALGPVALVFHHRLIAFLDKNGNVRADPHWLKGEVLPRMSGSTPEDCRMFAAGLVEHGLAVPYEVDGVGYLHFPRFRDNQQGLRPDREAREVPIPQGFNEASGHLPEDFRSTSGVLPEALRPEVEVEVEVEEQKNATRFSGADAPTTGRAVAVRAGGQVGGSDPGPPPAPDQPASDLELARALVGAWVADQPARPPDPDIRKQGAAAKRLACGRSPDEILTAVRGIGAIAPYSMGEPWDLFDLEKKFAKAHAAGAADELGGLKVDRDRNAILDAIRGGAHAR